jgi:hypothetical protein
VRRRWEHSVVADEAVRDIDVEVVFVAESRALELLRRPVGIAITVRRLPLLHDAGVDHLPLARLEGRQVDEGPHLREQRLHASRTESLAEAPDRRIIRCLLRQINAEKALEREQFGDLVLHLLVRQRLQLAQHQHLEHAHRIMRRATVLARVMTFVGIDSSVVRKIFLGMIVFSTASGSPSASSVRCRIS